MSSGRTSHPPVSPGSTWSPTLYLCTHTYVCWQHFKKLFKNKRKRKLKIHEINIKRNATTPPPSPFHLFLLTHQGICIVLDHNFNLCPWRGDAGTPPAPRKAGGFTQGSCFVSEVHSVVCCCQFSSEWLARDVVLQSWLGRETPGSCWLRWCCIYLHIKSQELVPRCPARIGHKKSPWLKLQASFGSTSTSAH